MPAKQGTVEPVQEEKTPVRLFNVVDLKDDSLQFKVRVHRQNWEDIPVRTRVALMNEMSSLQMRILDLLEGQVSGKA